MDATEFGVFVRDARKALRLRQEDLAMMSGTSRKFVIDLEQGKPSCSLGLALRVATALGLDFRVGDSVQPETRAP